jgi:cyclin-dependent kinase 8/11
MVADAPSKQRSRPEWLQQYELVGKIGEGTYGLVYLARSKEPAHRYTELSLSLSLSNPLIMRIVGFE